MVVFLRPTYDILIPHKNYVRLCDLRTLIQFHSDREMLPLYKKEVRYENEAYLNCHKEIVSIPCFLAIPSSGRKQAKGNKSGILIIPSGISAFRHPLSIFRHAVFIATQTHLLPHTCACLVSGVALVLFQTPKIHFQFCYLLAVQL